MAADEFGSGVHHNICAVLNGANEIGCAKGVVNDQGQTALVGKGRNGIDIRDIAVGIAQGFQIDGFCVGSNGLFHLCQIVGIHKGGGDPIERQGVGQQIITAAVDGLLGYNVISCLGQRLNGIGDGGSAGGQGQGCYTSLQRRNPLFQHILCGIGQAAVNISGIRQTEAGRCVRGVVEHIGGGLVNGDGAGIGGGIGLFLTHMELQCFKFIMTHFDNLFLFLLCCGMKKAGAKFAPGLYMVRYSIHTHAQ